MTARIPLVINSGAIQELQSGDTFNLGTGATLVSPVITGTGTAIFSQVNIVGQGDLRLEDTTGGEYVALQAPTSLASSYTLTLPIDDGTNGQALITDGSGNLSWSTAASGDVYGPASATDNAVARFDLTTGKLIQNSVVTIGDTGDVAGVGALSMSGAVTLSGGTANGVAYLNGSKVLTTGSALTFNGAVFVAPNLQFGSSNNSLYQSASTTAALRVGTSPSYFGFKDVSGLPLFDGPGSQLGFGVGGSEQMRLTSTGLGIGTSSPSGKLDVTGNLGTVRVTTNGAQLDFTRNSASYIRATDAAGYLVFATGGAVDRMTLDSSGNLGLGVTPSAWSTFKVLDIGSGSLANYIGTTPGALALFQNSYFDGANYKYKNTGAAALFSVQADAKFAWSTAPSGTAGNAISFTQAMTLDASGNLGIGTSSPGQKLQVNGNALLGTGSWLGFPDSAGAVLRFSNGEYIATTGQQLQLCADNADGTIAFCTTSTGSASRERMRIDSSGNVGIGTSSPSQKLNVSENSVTWCVSNAGGTSYTGTTTNSNLALLTNSTERMRITSDGEVYIAGTTDQGAYNLQCNGTGVWGAGAYVNGSDAALKENVTTLDNSLGLINAMRPVTFTYKENYSKDRAVQTGFIAQELQEVLAGKDYLDGIVQAGPEHLNVAYQNLIPLLVKAVQELTARVAKLEGN